MGQHYVISFVLVSFDNLCMWALFSSNDCANGGENYSSWTHISHDSPLIVHIPNTILISNKDTLVNFNFIHHTY